MSRIAGSSPRVAGRRTSTVGIPVLCFAGLLALGSFPCPLRAVELVSGVTDPAFLGNTASGASDGVGKAALSADGRYVAFTSVASNLVSGDTNATCDVFVRDLQSGTTARVSVGSAAAEGDGCSDEGALASGGRYAVFKSAASTLVDGDTNGTTDIFRMDLEVGTLVRVSTGSGGAQAYGDSREPVISADGRFVAFTSAATDLVPGDVDGLEDVYVKDLQTGTTVCASTNSSGVRGNNWSRSPSISADGRYVAFESGALNLTAGANGGLFVKDLQTGLVTCASTTPDGAQANGDSAEPFLSADGRYVTFRSYASNLAGGCLNVFVKDLQTGAVVCASTNADGVAANELAAQASSTDGRHVVFRSAATNLVDGTFYARDRVYLKDLLSGSITILSAAADGVAASDNSGSPAISADGRRVAFWSKDAGLVAGDANGVADVFVKDTVTGSLALASARDATVVMLFSVPGDSRSSGLSASEDGRFVLFTSRAATLVDGDSNGTWDVFVRDMQTGVTTRVSTDSAGVQADGLANGCAISGDGRYALFSSYAGNLVEGDTNATADIFVKDLLAGSTTRVSTDSSGVEANGGSACGGISHDGRIVTFSSLASNLVPGDVNGKSDIFIKDRLSGAITRESTGSSGTEANGDSYFPAVSGDGRSVAFRSAAGNLVDGDTGAADIFVKNRETGVTVRASTSSAGAQANGSSDLPVLSYDGRFVAFQSAANNLVSGDTNTWQDIFVKDLQTGATRIASTGTYGERAILDCAAPAISADGRYVVFSNGGPGLAGNDTNIFSDVFLKDLRLGTLDLVSVGRAGEAGDGAATNPAISGDGRQVVFTSAATNLVNGDGNGALDVFRTAVHSDLRLRVAGTTAATAGKKALFWITFSTAGPNTAQDVSVTTAVPAGSTFADARADRPGWTISAPAVGGTGQIVFSRPYATLGVEHKFTVLLDVDPAVEAGAALTLGAQAASTTPDLHPEDDVASWTQTVASAADLAVSATSPDTVEPGGTYDVVLTVTNNGPSVARDVVLATTFPDGTAFVSQAQTAGPAFDLGSGRPLTNTAASLAPGAGAVFRITVAAGADLAEGTVLVTASSVAASTGDPPPGDANNTAAATTSVKTVDDPPTLDPVEDVTIDEDSAAQVVNLGGISAGPGESQTLSVTAVSSNPDVIPGPDVTYVSPAATGSLSFTPVADASGHVTITVSVDDGAATTSRSFTIAVLPVNDAPIAAADAHVVQRGGWLTQPAPGVLGNDTDVDGDALAAVKVSDPLHGTLTLNADGSFSYVHDGSAALSDTFSYQASDGTVSSSVATVTIAVSDPPGAFPKNAPVNASTGQATSLTLSWSASSGATSYEYCCDTDGGDICPGGWTSADAGTSVGVSGLNTNTTYSWQVRARNASGTTDADAGARWSFRTANLPPVLGPVGDKASTEGKALQFSLTANDPDSGTLEYGAAAMPSGAVLDPDTGAFSWTPGYDQAGSYPVTFTVRDESSTDSETITITVGNPTGPIFRDDFSDGAAFTDWRRVSGSWLASAGVYAARSLTLTNLARIAPLDPSARPIGAGMMQARVKITSAGSGAWPNASLVFGYTDPKHYRWVRITGTEVQIGQTGNVGGVAGGVKRRVARSHAIGRSILLTVKIYPSGWVRVYEGAGLRAVAAYRFLLGVLPSVARGGAGLAASRTRTIFDDVRVWDESALVP
ncbi:MAG TPA: Ig-like domain-containing protein [bacterium]